MKIGSRKATDLRDNNPMIAELSVKLDISIFNHDHLICHIIVTPLKFVHLSPCAALLLVSICLFKYLIIYISICLINYLDFIF